MEPVFPRLAVFKQSAHTALISPSMSKPAKLLLVDSDRSSLEAFRSALAHTDYQILTAESAHEGLQLNSREQPDLVILDMHLPNLSSIDLAGKLLDAGSPFIFLCNHGSVIPLDQADDQGSLAILKKPRNLTNLIPGIEAALAWAQEIRRLRETESRYRKAIETGKVVDVVVGILMERHHLDRHNAYELLRTKARSERRRLIDLAQEILDAHDRLNQVTP